MENNQNKEWINPEALGQVAGGAGLAEEKQAEFEAAWDKLMMDQEGCSGMQKAELFIGWQTAGYPVDAADFIKKNR